MFFCSLTVNLYRHYQQSPKLHIDKILNVHFISLIYIVRFCTRSSQKSIHHCMFLLTLQPNLEHLLACCCPTLQDPLVAPSLPSIYTFHLLPLDVYIAWTIVSTNLFSTRSNTPLLHNPLFPLLSVEIFRSLQPLLLPADPLPPFALHPSGSFVLLAPLLSALHLFLQHATQPSHQLFVFQQFLLFPLNPLISYIFSLRF